MHGNHVTVVISLPCKSKHGRQTEDAEAGRPEYKAQGRMQREHPATVALIRLLTTGGPLRTPCPCTRPPPTSSRLSST